MRKPVVGDVVLYIDSEGAEQRATIGFVWTGSKVDLIYFLEAVRVEVEKVPYSVKGERRSWCWAEKEEAPRTPPRSSAPSRKGSGKAKEPAPVESQAPPPPSVPLDPDGKPPTLLLDFDKVFCRRHGELYRENWPEGFAVFMVKGLEKLALFAQVPEGLPLNQAVGWVSLALSDSPICCRLSRLDFVRVVLTTRKWKKGLCVHCKQLKEGASYTVSGLDRKVQTWRHICVWCVVWKLAPDPQLASEEEIRRYKEERDR